LIVASEPALFFFSIAVFAIYSPYYLLFIFYF